ncbi:MAG: thiol peroxidase [Flavobacteriales bacterium]
MAASTKLKGEAVQLNGELPQEGTEAPDFRFVRKDMSEGKLSDLKGKPTVLIAVPSVDTPVCANEAKQFNQKLSEIGAQGLVVSEDLPFALSRFCEAEGIENVDTVSDFRYGDFVDKYKTGIAEGPFQGLSARAVFVVDPDGKLAHTQLVPEIGEEPDYGTVIDHLKELVA